MSEIEQKLVDLGFKNTSDYEGIKYTLKLEFYELPITVMLEKEIRVVLEDDLYIDLPIATIEGIELLIKAFTI